MTMKSFFDKHSKTIAAIATVLAIADLLLKWFEILPRWITILILIISIIMITPFILKLKSQTTPRLFRLWIGLIVLFYIGLGYHFLTSKSSSDPESITLATKNITTDNHSATANTSTTDQSNKVATTNIKNNLEIKAPITANDNSEVTIANEVNNNYYNKAPQRHVNDNDANKLQKISPSAERIQIWHASNDKESTIFADEILKKLFDLGYKNISKSSTDIPFKKSTDRLNISESNEQQNTINIYVNSQ